MSHQIHTALYEAEAVVTPLHTNATRGYSDPPQVLQLVGGGARTPTLACVPPEPWAHTTPGPQEPWLLAYRAAGRAEPASSPAPPGAPAEPSPAGPGAPAGVPDAGPGGRGWIPSSSAPLWPVGKSWGKGVQGPPGTRGSSVESSSGHSERSTTRLR